MSETTNHPDEGLIHDLVDDELAADERARIEAHVAACASCGALADSIRRLREDARRAFASAGPDDALDQWNAIDAAIETRRRARSRAPLAAAAVIALLVGSGAVLYAVMGRPAPAEQAAPTVAVVADEAPAAAIAVAYAPTLAELEQILAVDRANLQPETIATLDANLAILNTAIREIEAALAADPGHHGHLRSLDGMYQTKVGVLRQVVTMASGA